MFMRLAFLLCIFLSVSIHVGAQDVLYLTNGTNHLVEVISADELEIKYKKFDDLDGPELTMTVFKLRRILYDDGTMINYGNPLVRNMHFREHIDQGEMIFSYRLHDGPSPTTNALHIMALEGLPVEWPDDLQRPDENDQQEIPQSS